MDFLKIIYCLKHNLVDPQDKAKEVLQTFSIKEINKYTGLSKPTIAKLKNGKSLKNSHNATISVLSGFYDNVIQALKNTFDE